MFPSPGNPIVNLSNTGATAPAPFTQGPSIDQYIQAAGLQPQQPQVQDASTQQQQPSTGGGSAAPNNQAMAQQMLGHVQGLVSNLNDMYNTLYGNYGDAVQNQRNSLEEGYLPQYAQNQAQAQQNSQQLDWQALANGMGASSFAGQQQQNLATNAQNAAAAITADRDQKENQLASDSASQLATYKSQQQGMNDQLALMNQLIPNDVSGSGLYRLGSFQDSLTNQTRPGLSAELAKAQPGGQLYNQLQQIAPSQVYNPQTLQDQLTGINKSSLPTYLQNQLQSGAIASATSNPGDTNYWLNYVKNLQPAT